MGDRPILSERLERLESLRLGLDVAKKAHLESPIEPGHAKYAAYLNAKRQYEKALEELHPSLLARIETLEKERDDLRFALKDAISIGNIRLSETDESTPELAEFLKTAERGNAVETEVPNESV